MLETLLPRRLRRSYPTRLVVAFALVTLVIGAVGVVLYVQTGTMLEGETTTELRSAAQIEAQALDEWFDQKRLQTRAAAESAAFRSRDDSAVVRQLWTIVDRDEDVEAAYFVDTGNRTVVSSVGTSRIVSSQSVVNTSGQRDFTRRAGDGETMAVSRPFRPYGGSAPVILLSVAVPDRSNRSLVTVVNLEQLSDSQAHRLDRARFQVVDATGTVVMAENGSRILTETRLADTLPAGTGFTMTDYAGEDVAVGYASLDEFDWTVTARMTTGDAFALRSAVLEGVLWMLATVVVGLGAIALTLTHSTITPVRDLAATARELQDGDLDDPVATTRVDEFGDLYDAFEEMRVSLREHIERVEQSRQAAQDAQREAERARRESERLTEYLQEEAERFGEVMAACADGDLDRRLSPSSDSEPMQDIAVAFNRMMDDVQQQNEQLEAFTSIISHDLRNPLAVALGRAELLDHETESEHVASILDSLRRMEAIIEDGMTLARGTSVEETTTVAIADHAERAWRHVDSPGAALSVVGEKTIDADPNLLEQVFENLFRNAVEHGSTSNRPQADDAVEHGGPDVTVTVGVTDWGFYVADDGPGLPPEDIDSVFEPGVTENTNGTGLGLTIVRRIAEAHGWSARGTNGTTGARFEFVTSPTATVGDGHVSDTASDTVSDGADTA